MWEEEVGMWKQSILILMLLASVLIVYSLYSGSSHMSDKIPAQYKNKEGYWTYVHGGLAIGVNQTVWRQDPQLASLPLPQRYEDLLRPELRGKLETPNPETSGTGYTLLASLAQQRGEDKAIHLMQALNKQSSSTTFTGITSAQRLAVGDVVAVVCFLGDQLRFTNSGYNINSYIPPQAGWEIGAVSILKNGNNTAAAKKLVDFVLSKDVQTDYMYTAFSLPVLPDTLVNPLLSHVKLENLLVPYRFDIVAQHRDQLLKRWRSVK